MPKCQDSWVRIEPNRGAVELTLVDRNDCLAHSFVLGLSPETACMIAKRLGEAAFRIMERKSKQEYVDADTDAPTALIISEPAP